MFVQYFRYSLALLLIFLIGCHKNWAPVNDLNRAPAKLSGTHVVQSGETLYAISWRYNRDAKELAAVNNLSEPYTLREGQTLSLAQASAQPAATPSRATTTTTTVVASSVANKPVNGWQWPAQGEMIGNFAQNKGLDIAGNEGDAVVAAADGEVVYSGSGLRGYGQLLIIKHNEQYLSAYAHNSRLEVKEGDTVKVGQKIAEMGNTGTNRVKLHFEIRQDGKPVDPMQYLPA